MGDGLEAWLSCLIAQSEIARHRLCLEVGELDGAYRLPICFFPYEFYMPKAA